MSSTPSTGVVSSCDPDQPYSSLASSDQVAPNQQREEEPNQREEEEYLSDTCSHCAISRGGVVVTVTNTETASFPCESVPSLSTGNRISSQAKGDQGRSREEEESGVMDATASYMMTNVNASTPALLSTPATHHHHPAHQHSHHSSIQYQSPPNTATHSVPLLATPVLSMVDSHYLTQTGQAVTLINPAATCLTSNNDPQQLQHVMIPGMVPTTFQDNGENGFLLTFTDILFSYNANIMTHPFISLLPS